MSIRLKNMFLIFTLHVYVCIHVCICTEKEGKHTFELKSVFEEGSVLWGRWEENENLRTKLTTRNQPAHMFLCG